MSISPSSAVQPLSLRSILARDHTCDQLFKQAETLAVHLFDPAKPPSPKCVVPFFTDHSAVHLRRVEMYLDQLLFGADGKARLDSAAFVPTPEEAMYLLSAAWLHDIGMIAGIFNGEPADQDADWNHIRDDHEFRASRYIQHVWQANSDWTTDQRLALAQLCIYHRKRHPLREMQPVSLEGASGELVRLRELAALLRLADACHIDASRAPGEMKNLYTAIGMPCDSLPHWGMPQFITRIVFDHERKVLRLVCRIPPPTTFGTVVVDFTGVIRHIVGGIREELRGVEGYLIRYSNTAFKEVRPEISRPAALRDPVKEMRELWPYLLSSPGSACEVACMVAALVHTIVQDGQQHPQALSQFLNRAVHIHQYNFLVRNLAERVRQLLAERAPAETICRELEAYLEGRKRANIRVAESAYDTLEIGHDDWLVVHGFSHTVLTYLRRHRQGHRGKILIVECARSSPAQGTCRSDARRFHAELTGLGFECYRVKLQSLPVIFSRQQQQASKVKVLLGARGVTANEEVLSIVGSAMVAMAAKKYGGQVYILADRGKLRATEGQQKQIDSELDQLAQRLITSSGSDDMRPQIDILDKSMYDKIHFPVQDEQASTTPKASP